MELSKGVRVFFALCACLLASPASLLAAPPSDELSDIQEIVERGKLVVALTATDSPPFYVAGRDGKLSGYDIKLAEDIAAEMGVPVEFDRSSKTFDGLVDVVSTGKADIAISKLSKTLKRSKRVMFTEPYLVLRKALLLNRLELAKRRGDRSTPEFVQHLEGSVGVIKGSSYEEFAKQMFPQAETVPYDSWEKILKDVYTGKLTAAFRDELEVKRGVATLPEAGLRLQSVMFSDSEDPIAMAVSAERPHLCYWLNHYLSVKKVRIGVDELLDNYAGLCGEAGSQRSLAEVK